MASHQGTPDARACLAPPLPAQNVTYSVPTDQQDDLCRGPLGSELSWLAAPTNGSNGTLGYSAAGGELSSQGRMCPWEPSAAYPYGMACVSWGNPGADAGDPSLGFRDFDNILYSFLVIFQHMTLTDWTEVMYDTQDALSWWTWVLHVTMVRCCIMLAGGAGRSLGPWRGCCTSPWCTWRSGEGGTQHLLVRPPPPLAPQPRHWLQDRWLQDRTADPRDARHDDDGACRAARAVDVTRICPQVVIGGLVLVNLVLAVLYMQFQADSNKAKGEGNGARPPRSSRPQQCRRPFPPSTIADRAGGFASDPQQNSDPLAMRSRLASTAESGGASLTSPGPDDQHSEAAGVNGMDKVALPGAPADGATVTAAVVAQQHEPGHKLQWASLEAAPPEAQPVPPGVPQHANEREELGLQAQGSEARVANVERASDSMSVRAVKHLQLDAEEEEEEEEEHRQAGEHGQEQADGGGGGRAAGIAALLPRGAAGPEAQQGQPPGVGPADVVEVHPPGAVAEAAEQQGASPFDSRNGSQGGASASQGTAGQDAVDAGWEEDDMEEVRAFPPPSKQRCARVLSVGQMTQSESCARGCLVCAAACDGRLGPVPGGVRVPGLQPVVRAGQRLHHHPQRHHPSLQL